MSRHARSPAPKEHLCRSSTPRSSRVLIQTLTGSNRAPPILESDSSPGAIFWKSSAAPSTARRRRRRLYRERVSSSGEERKPGRIDIIRGAFSAMPVVRDHP